MWMGYTSTVLPFLTLHQCTRLCILNHHVNWPHRVPLIPQPCLPLLNMQHFMQQISSYVNLLACRKRSIHNVDIYQCLYILKSVAFSRNFCTANYHFHPTTHYSLNLIFLDCTLFMSHYGKIITIKTDWKPVSCAISWHACFASSTLFLISL